MNNNQGNYDNFNLMSPAEWSVNNGLEIPTTNLEIPLTYFCGMIPPIENNYSQQARTTSNVVPKFNLNAPITLSNAVLIPPLPGTEISRRPKPDGCRTVYVGKLPEKITEDIIKEAFERCGSILNIRMSDRLYCHIKFMDMESVEQALLLSGCRIKIENKDDPAYNKTIYVDYAYDNRYDFELRKRQREQEDWHHAKKSRPLRPPPIFSFSNHKAISVNDKLHCEETFKEGAQILNTWLNRGECSKKNHSEFYNMLQSVNSHVKELTKEKSRCEEEVKTAKEKLDIVARNIQLKLSIIEKVNAAAKVRKNWDHFSKGQRRQIDDWEKKITSFSADLIAIRVEEGMDLDMDENAEECRNEDLTVNDELYELRESYDTLKQELTLTQKELNDYKQTSDYARKDVSVTNSSTQCAPDEVDVTENETCLVTLILGFLRVHPFGASIDYIHSYVLEMYPATTVRDIESLLRKFPNILEEESTGIGATLQKKWKYVTFDSSALPNSHYYFDNGRKDVSVCNSSTQCVPDKVDVTENETCLLSLISVFLLVHRFGANIDYIHSYVLEMHPATTVRDIESLLRKFPHIFGEVSTGIGATLQKKWKCIAFDFLALPNSHYFDNARKNVSVSNSSTQCVPDKVDVTENEIYLLSLILGFLRVHPFGANIYYIHSYMLEMYPATTIRDIESLLRKFPNILEEVSTGIGATLQKKWKCVAFDSSALPNSHHYFDNGRKDVSVSNSSMQCVPDKVDVTENETCLFTLISFFLLVHRFGANIDYIHSYVLEMHPAATVRDIESLLRKFPHIFEEFLILSCH